MTASCRTRLAGHAHQSSRTNRRKSGFRPFSCVDPVQQTAQTSQHPTVTQYRLSAVIGAGGMGEVHCADWPEPIGSSETACSRTHKQNGLSVATMVSLGLLANLLRQVIRGLQFRAYNYSGG